MCDGIISLTHGDLAFTDSLIYGRSSHTINFDDMRDADFSVDKNQVNKILIKTIPYVIKTKDNKYLFGTEEIIDVDQMDPEIYHITCTNLRCKLKEYFHLLKKDDIYVEIGVKFGAAANGILEYSNKNNLNISINLFEKDHNCCDFLRQRFNDNNTVNIFEGDATKKWMN